MGERSYLAIGDVLALLREEFPDVTISKIRFLESRGLLDPERTPSGYRKFYEPDVDRLRWILRQQREHFLPLKVIKGRLENGMSDPEAPTPHLLEMGDPPPEHEAEPVLVGAIGASDLVVERSPGGLSALTPIASVAATFGQTPTRRGSTVVASSEGTPQAGLEAPSVAGVPGPRTPSAASQDDEVRHAPLAEAPAATTGSQSRRRRPQSAAAERAANERSAELGNAPGAKGAEEPAPAAEARADVETEPAPVRRPARPTAGLPGAGLSGASLTLMELASASGLQVKGIEELESYGLIAGRTVAGIHCYDEDAVLVAKLAARFAPYGIEARHLKIFKHAADRQSGLFAQVVTPLLRQRNPQAHARAIEDLSDLAELGEALMRCFSQATLRELTGG